MPTYKELPTPGRFVVTAGKHSLTLFPNTESTRGTSPFSSQNAVYRSISWDLRMVVAGLSATLMLSRSQLMAVAFASERDEGVGGVGEVGETNFLGGPGAVTARRDGPKVDGPGSSSPPLGDKT